MTNRGMNIRPCRDKPCGKDGTASVPIHLVVTTLGGKPRLRLLLRALENLQIGNTHRVVEGISGGGKESLGSLGCGIMNFMKAPDITPYLSGWKKRIEIEEEKRRKRAREALRVALTIAKTLVKKGKAKRVYLFGSLAFSMKGGGRFGVTSDIDLAVEALPKKEYFQILAEVNRMSDFEVDLVDLQACSAPLREAILKNGVLLYGEEGSNSLTFE